MNPLEPSTLPRLTRHLRSHALPGTDPENLAGDLWLECWASGRSISRRVASLRLLDLHPHISLPVEPSTTPSSLYEAREFLGELLQRANLPDLTLQVLVLHAEGRTDLEIAQGLGCSPVTVHSTLVQAKSTLQSLAREILK